MKKSLSLLLTLCMMLSFFSGAVFFGSSAATYETIELNGFSTWTQAEMDKSSGNNGYANGCCTYLTVVTDSEYRVGDTKQAIKAVFGNSGTPYNNCIVNWTYGTGGPSTVGNVWAPADGSSVSYSDYDGIRVAVLNANGEPANFNRITFRVTEGWNYSNNMRYWDSAIVRDDEGYFYFDFDSFVAHGSPAGSNIYDYLQNTAKGISMLCYGGADENTCYYSSVQLYKKAGSVKKGLLKEAVDKLRGYDAVTYAAQIAAATAVLNDSSATQEQVDAQLAIIEECIKQYTIALSSGYTYVPLNGIQNWTESEAASMNGFGSTYSISDKGLIGDATQSIKLTSEKSQDRFCFATQKSDASFSTVNPYTLKNASDGKLSDYDGIAIAFCDENGEQIQISKFTARLMRDKNDWDNYWLYQADYVDMDSCYVNGYYHLKFSDYKALTAKDIDSLAIMSILFYKSVANGDVAYISDMKAYNYEEPEVVEYEYLLLNGVQGWTDEHLSQTSANNGHLNNVTATYSISEMWTVGAAAQSIKAVKSSANAGFNCLVNKAYDSNGIAAPSPWVPSDGISKLSQYDGVMIAVKDQNGNLPNATKVRLRILTDPAANGWGVHYEGSKYETTDDGYMVFKFKDFPNYTSLLADIDRAQGISFLIDDVGQTEYYFSEFKAFREKRDVDYTELQNAVELMKENNADGRYDKEIAESEAVINNPDATQADINAQLSVLNKILRSILLKPVEFDEDNIVVSFGAVSDIHIKESVDDSTTQKYVKALELLKKYAGGKLDAITIAGDISNSNYSSGIGTAFKTVTDNALGENANVFFVSGNHDAQGSEWSTLAQFYSDLGKYTANDLSSSQHNRGNRHKVINGYHYLAVNMMDYWNSAEAKFDTKDLEWLAGELEAARKDAPGQPIFVYVHAGVYGTTYGSDLYTGTHWGSRAIYSYLENYPEVVTFSGHVHFPLADERTIYQKDFTSLNCGSVQYMAIENGYLETGGKTTCDASWGVSGGLLVQVDKNNNLKITRLDFANDSVIKQPFYISAPDLENKSNLLHYNDDYFNLDNTAPVFSKSASVTAELSGSNIKLSFDAAIDNDMVHHYLFEIKGLPSGTVKNVKSFSEFYLYPTAKDFPKTYNRTIPYTAAAGDEAFEIRVYAVDSMGLKSDPIIYNSIVNKVNLPVSKGQNLLNVDFITGEPRNNTIVASTIIDSGVSIIKNGAKYGYAPDEGSKLSIRAANSINTLSARKFLVDVIFGVGEVGAEQYIFGCYDREAGYKLYLTAEGKIAFAMHSAKGKSEVITDVTVASGELRNVIVNFASGSVTVYVDGVAAGSATVDGNATFPSAVYTVGASNDADNKQLFSGIIYQIGIGSNGITEEQLAERQQNIKNALSYKILQALYDELEYVNEIIALNGKNYQVITVANNYIKELEAALSAMVIDEQWLEPIIRTDDFNNTVKVLGGTVEVKSLTAPVISGVEDGATYDLANGEVIPSWDNATGAEMNFETVASGTAITKPGKYQLLVQNKYASTVVEFTVISSFTLPVVSGVEEGASYDLYLGQAPSITFDVGEATLNGEVYVSGTAIDVVGEYVFKVVNGDKEVEISFSVIDTTPQYKKGDFDNDGEITVADALAALRIAARMVECTESDILIGDIDVDGEITVADALAILRVAARMSDNL